MQLLMVCLLVEVTLSALVNASALQQCMQSSKYSSHYGTALLGYSYKSFTTNLLITCYRACQQEPSCQSLNYNLAKRICEFNTYAKRPEDLEDKLDNFVYAVNPNRKVEGRSRRHTSQRPHKLPELSLRAALFSGEPREVKREKHAKGARVQGREKKGRARLHIPDHGKPY